MKEMTLTLLQAKKYKELKAVLETMNPADIAALFEELTTEDMILVFRLLPKELAAETFVYMEGDKQELLISAFSDKELEEVMTEMFLDDAVDLIEEMPANVVKRILMHIEPDMRNMINEILKYPGDSAGSIMTIEFVALKRDMTVEEAFTKIRETGVDKETIYTCYVTNPDRKLIGAVTVRNLLLSDYTRKIEDIMETNVISVHTLDDKEFVAKQMTKYDFLAIPVVDNEDRLVGIVTFDDAMDVIEDETEEDFAIMAAMTPSEDSYFKTSVFSHAKNRIVWLLFLMLSATVTGIIITKYENAFSAIPILVAFIPMLMDTGGNCGSQSSTMIIRGLALDEIKMGDIIKVMFKELRISLLVGLVLALVNGVRIYIMYSSTSEYSNFQLSLVVGLTILCTVTLAKLLGCILPLAAKRLKLDPAIMAAPLITTVVDTCSVLIFFNIAMRVMHIA